jgi:chromosome segregation ATPase
MKSRKQILREYAQDPAKLAARVLELHQQLQDKDRKLEDAEQCVQGTQKQFQQTQEQLTLKEQELAQAQALIAELKQELFGPKADTLNAEQEEQLSQLFQDAQEQAQRPEPLSREVLQDFAAQVN